MKATRPTVCRGNVGPSVLTKTNTDDTNSSLSKLKDIEYQLSCGKREAGKSGLAEMGRGQLDGLAFSSTHPHRR